MFKSTRTKRVFALVLIMALVMSSVFASGDDFGFNSYMTKIKNWFYAIVGGLLVPVFGFAAACYAVPCPSRAEPQYTDRAQGIMDNVVGLFQKLKIWLSGLKPLYLSEKQVSMTKPKKRRGVVKEKAESEANK